MQNDPRSSAEKSIPSFPSHDYLHNHELADFCRKLADAAPGFVRLTSIGQSREGRKIPLLTVTDFSVGKPEDKPGILLTGNRHALELAGSHSVLYTAWMLVRDYRKLLKANVFYLVPRISPDGVDQVMKYSLNVRSRVDYSSNLPNMVVPEDINSDGKILMMRIESPDGDNARDSKQPRLLVPRTKDTPGPYYRVWTEGKIHHWDGTGNLQNSPGERIDFERNWPMDWQPCPSHGDFPLCEPENLYLAKFIASRRNLYAVIDCHTGARGVIYPEAEFFKSEADFNLMKLWSERSAFHLGFPACSVYTYSNYANSSQSLPGDSTKGLYGIFGILSVKPELGGMMDEAEKFLHKTISNGDYQNKTPLQQKMRDALEWQNAHPNREKVYFDWKEFTHPQLGKVDIGGWNVKTFRSPPIERMADISSGVCRFVVELADKFAPRLAFTVPKVVKTADSEWLIQIDVVNHGGLATNVTEHGLSVAWRWLPLVEFHPGNGVKLLSEYGHRTLKHLAPGESIPLKWKLHATENARTLCSLRLIGYAGGTSKLEIAVP